MKEKTYPINKTLREKVQDIIWRIEGRIEILETQIQEYKKEERMLKVAERSSLKNTLQMVMDDLNEAIKA